jgi:tetratricopeptide (TPR) repeat protein
MNNKKQWQKAVFSAFVIWAILISGLTFSAQDIVTSEDIAGGSSIFVFRQSRKPPQAKVAFRQTGGGRTVAQRKESHKKVRTQANTAVASQRPRTPKVDPTIVAVNKPQGNTGKPIGKPTPVDPRANEKESIVFAGAAETYLENNDLDRAIEHFQRAIVLHPQNENARLGLSEAYIRKGDAALEKDDIPGAEKFYTQSLKYNEKNAPAFAGLGEVFEAMESPDKAIQNYEKALSINPGLNEIYTPLGLLYSQKGDIAQSDNYLTKAVEKNPSDAVAQFNLGLIRYRQQNRNEEALAAFTQAAAYNPNSAEAQYFLGETYDRLNRENESLVAYNKAVQINPNYLEAWFDLGVAYFNRGRYQESVNAYKQVLRLKNDYAQAHANLADVYRLMAMEEKDATKRNELFGMANGSYTLAEVFIKNDPELYNNWAYSLGRVRNWETAVRRLDAAVQLNPDASYYTNIGWAYLNSARDDLNFKREAEAKVKLEKGKQALQKATEINPNYFAAFMNLGLTLQDLSDFQGVVNALLTAVRLREDWEPANLELGFAYRQLNDLSNAVRYLKRATEINDRNPWGWYHLGEAEYRRGNVKEARQAQEKLKQLNITGADGLSKRLDLIIKGAVPRETKNKIENKIQQKNPVNKLPRVPRLPY